jgi:Uma2 family endonuclease
MQIALPENEDRLSFQSFLAFCEANPDLRVERTNRGEIIVVPPVGGESDYRCVEVSGELRNWAKKNRSGKAFGSSAGFILPDGAILSPDAAWVSNDRIAQVSKSERKGFVRAVPEFVVEVLSPTDRLTTAKAKMREWIANGVELAWLIDGDSRQVHIYRQGQEPRVVSGVDTVAGEGPVEGFTLELNDIWEGL